jgi:hypothetical protein
MNKQWILAGIVSVVLLVLAYIFFMPLTDAQNEKIEFDNKCRATPTLEECKDWKETYGSQ